MKWVGVNKSMSRPFNNFRVCHYRVHTRDIGVKATKNALIPTHAFANMHVNNNDAVGIACAFSKTPDHLVEIVCDLRRSIQSDN